MILRYLEDRVGLLQYVGALLDSWRKYWTSGSEERVDKNKVGTRRENHTHQEWIIYEWRARTPDKIEWLWAKMRKYIRTANRLTKSPRVSEKTTTGEVQLNIGSYRRSVTLVLQHFHFSMVFTAMFTFQQPFFITKSFACFSGYTWWKCIILAFISNLESIL